MIKMNVVHAGDTFRIYGEALKTYNSLPILTYEVGFSKQSGFYLTQHCDLEVKETKVYGNHQRRIQKALRSFELTDRNFGIILSGPKGTGKSLFARMLSQEAMKSGYPVILVPGYIPGIAGFLSGIDQEAVVLFDEFEKTFAATDDFSPQEDMLSLFDGIDGGKKMFVITCNEVNKLNSYLLNRPGRFHYHFIIGNPDPAEIREYLQDKMVIQDENIIQQVINFSMTAGVTYDVLRAMAFEFNQGSSFEDALMDLNIAKEGVPYYKIRVVFADGGTCETRTRIDFFSATEDIMYEWFHTTYLGRNYGCRLSYKIKDVVFDYYSRLMTLDPAKTSFALDEDYFEDVKPEIKEQFVNRKIVSIEFTKEDNTYAGKYIDV